MEFSSFLLKIGVETTISFISLSISLMIGEDFDTLATGMTKIQEVFQLEKIQQWNRIGLKILNTVLKLSQISLLSSLFLWLRTMDEYRNEINKGKLLSIWNTRLKKLFYL